MGRMLAIEKNTFKKNQQLELINRDIIRKLSFEVKEFFMLILKIRSLFNFV